MCFGAILRVGIAGTGILAKEYLFPGNETEYLFSFGVCRHRVGAQTRERFAANPRMRRRMRLSIRRELANNRGLITFAEPRAPAHCSWDRCGDRQAPVRARAEVGVHACCASRSSKSSGPSDQRAARVTSSLLHPTALHLHYFRYRISRAAPKGRLPLCP